MGGKQKEDLLLELMEEIELAWNERGDVETVHRLAAEHPEVMEELYEFFADLMEARDDLGRERSEYSDLDRRIRDYLEREGFQRAADARQSIASGTSTATDYETVSRNMPPPRLVAESPSAPKNPKGSTFLGALGRATSAPVDTLAGALGITADFLVVVSENGAVVPMAARHELVRRARSVYDVLNENELLSSFDVQPPAMMRAASRKSAFKMNAVSFELLVKQSGLRDVQKQYWLSLG